jgi:cell division protein FtsB
MRKLWQSSLVLLGCIALAAYFILHAIYGRYGLEAQSGLISQSAELTRELESLEAVHARLSRHVGLLAGEPPARDLTEEIARRDLGFAYPQDIIIRR